MKVRKYVLLPVGYIHGLMPGDQWYSEPSMEELDVSEEASPAGDVLSPHHACHSAPSIGGRIFTERTPRELLALFEVEGRTALQADKLIEPHKGLWINVAGKLLQLLPDPHGYTVVLRSEPSRDLVNARFDKQWELVLGRLNTGDPVKVRGRLGNTQNGQQLYLLDCECS